YELLRGLHLDNVVLLGHSMGCSVIYGYWDNFGRGPIDRLVLVDQPPVLTAWPSWSAEEIAQAGSVFTPQSLYDTSVGLAGPDGNAVTATLISGLFSSSFPQDSLDAVIQETLKLPRLYAAQLSIDHGAKDWRDVISRIDAPALVVGGEISAVNPVSQE